MPLSSAAQAFAVTSLVCLLLEQAVRLAVRRKLIPPGDTARKLTHAAFGPVYVCCWPLFPATAPLARVWAATVPVLITAKFAAVGAGWLADEQTVAMLARRRGQPGEIFRGPLHYGLAFTLLPLLFWQAHPAATASVVASLCVGDVAAAIVGGRYGRTRLLRRASKTLEGTLGFVVASWAASVLAVQIMQIATGGPGLLSLPLLARLAVVAIAGAWAELFAPDERDNLPIFAASALAAHFLF